jgi:hypothetical protein
MNSNQLFKMVLNKYKDQPDDYALSIGHWENDNVFGAPLQEFHAYLKLTIGDIKKMLANDKKKTKPKE